jgi:SOS-response transcriptional repressor LexA
MTAGDAEMTTTHLAGAIVQGAPIDTSVTGAFVAVPREKLDTDDLVFRVARSDLRELGIERGDLLIVEPRPDGNAATAELVLVTLRDRAFVGRWWTKRGRRALLDHALAPIAEDHDLRVIGAVTVVAREPQKREVSPQ